MRTPAIRGLLDGVACPRCGAASEWILRGHAKTRLNSTTAIVRCPNCDASFFIKILESFGDEKQGAAEEEFAAAQRIHAAFPSCERFGVVRPYRLLAKDGLIFFDYVEGRDAAQLLMNLQPDLRKPLMERLGAWLKKFHLATGPTQGLADLQERVAALSARLEGNRPSSGVFDRSLARLTDDIPLSAGSSFLQVGLHGDCKLENFLVRGEQVVGIDVAWRYRNIAEYDLAQFLAQMTLTARSLGGRRIAGSCGELEDAFLRGYQVAGPESLRMVDWLKRYYLLSCWLSWRSRGPVQRAFWDLYFPVVLNGLGTGGNAHV